VGGPASELVWHSGRPCEGGACIEIAEGGEAVIMRSSVSPDATFTVSRDEWREFLASAKAGFFDET
jgi:hypothetical protein